MQKQENNFNYTYVAPTASERKHIERIRANYLPKEEDAFIKLKNLDKKVQIPPTVTAITLGVIGTLLFGLGLTFILEWDSLIVGVVFSTFSIFPILLAHPLYRAVYKRQKKKYAKEILELSEKLLKNS